MTAENNTVRPEVAGPDQCFVSITALGELVAIATDDEQRVVDSQREAQRCTQVEREGRHLGGKRNESQYGHRSHNGQYGLGHRQPGGQQPTEHPDQHQEAQRNRDQLHHQQVVFVLPIDLGVLHRRAAGTDGDAVAVMGDFV